MNDAPIKLDRNHAKTLLEALTIASKDGNWYGVRREPQDRLRAGNYEIKRSEIKFFISCIGIAVDGSRDLEFNRHCDALVKYLQAL